MMDLGHWSLVIGHWGKGVLRVTCYVLRWIGVAKGDIFYKKALRSNAIHNFSLFTFHFSLSGPRPEPLFTFHSSLHNAPKEAL